MGHDARPHDFDVAIAGGGLVGASLALANETLLTAFNTHFHVGNLGAPTSPPTVPAIPGVHSTVMTKGA